LTTFSISASVVCNIKSKEHQEPNRARQFDKHASVRKRRTCGQGSKTKPRLEQQLKEAETA
jgi:hypothetical protein